MTRGKQILNIKRANIKAVTASSSIWQVRDRTKLTKRKGRAQCGGVSEPVLLRELREGGQSLESSSITRSPVQLIEGLHGLPDDLVDRIDGRRREVDGG